MKIQVAVTAFLLALVMLLAVSDEAGATVPRCRDLTHPISVGQRCVDVRNIHARGDNDSDSFRSTYNSSWIVLEVDHNVAIRYGNTSGPHIRSYTAQTRQRSYESWNRATRELERLNAEAERVNPQTGQSEAYRYINNQLREFRNNRAILTSVDTNVATVEATVYASRRCTRSTPLGCVDWQGGSFSVNVYVYKMYVGTPELAETRLENVRRTALRLLNNERGSGNPAPTPGNRVTLRRGFMPDPHVLSISTRGAVPSTRLHSACRGYVPASPTKTLQWSGLTRELRLFVVSATDTVLVVRGPDGNITCNDDWRSGDTNPMVRLSNAGSGEYTIWVGTYHSGRSASGALYITELAKTPANRR